MSPEHPTPRAVLEKVLDPEMPVLTIADLGVLRDVREVDGRVEVTITPTYSGCPAMDVIRADIETALHAAGYPDVVVRTVLAPAWTTEWITEHGRRALAAAGIAPPQPTTQGGGPVPIALSVPCPQCGSPDTRPQSQFGPTACTALWVCTSCREPFEYVKAF